MKKIIPLFFSFFTLPAFAQYAYVPAEWSIDYFTQEIINPINSNQQMQQEASNNLNCWDHAGLTYNVDPWLLYSIAKVESNYNPYAVNLNKNGSWDIGTMQINSAWLPTLKKFGIEKYHLFDHCLSIHIGAWVLAQNIRAFGFNHVAIGAYNAASHDKRMRYANKVLSVYGKITRQFGY